MTTLLLIRHGETEWNVEERIQGHGNSPLTARGRAQAEAVADRLAGVTVDAIYASDLGRVIETITPAARRIGKDVVTTRALREKHFGEWEGLSRAEVADRYPETWHNYHTLRNIYTHIPGGETWDDVAARTIGFVREVLARHKRDESIVIAGHGAALRPIIVHALDAPLTTLAHFSVDNASITTIRYRTPDYGRLISLNDCNHLEGVP